MANPPKFNSGKISLNVPGNHLVSYKNSSLVEKEDREAYLRAFYSPTRPYSHTPNVRLSREISADSRGHQIHGSALCPIEMDVNGDRRPLNIFVRLRKMDAVKLGYLDAQRASGTESDSLIYSFDQMTPRL